MANWRTARFDGSHHYPECEATHGCDCSARMSAQWLARDRALMSMLCEAADAQAPVAPVSEDPDRIPTQEVPITPMRDLMCPGTKEHEQAMRAAGGGR